LLREGFEAVSPVFSLRVGRNHSAFDFQPRTYVDIFMFFTIAGFEVFLTESFGCLDLLLLISNAVIQRPHTGTEVFQGG